MTAPDRVTLHAGEGDRVDVIANDSDPDGEQLEVCRLGALHRALRESTVQDGELVVIAHRKALGTYTVTYYACDSSYLTAGTLTVKVTPPAPTLDIVAVEGAPPGRVRLVNTYKHKTFHCRWMPLDSDRIEGKVTVPPSSTVVIRVKTAELQVDCNGGNVVYGAAFVDTDPDGAGASAS